MERTRFRDNQAQFNRETRSRSCETEAHTIAARIGSNYQEIPSQFLDTLCSAVRHNYARLKAQHAPRPRRMSSLDIPGCIRPAAEVRIRADLWRTRIYNAFSCGHPSWWRAYIHVHAVVYTCMYICAYTFISEWRPVHSSGVDATRQSDRCTKRTRRRPKLNNAWGGSNATFKCVYHCCRG